VFPIPGLSLHSNRGLELANPFGVPHRELAICSMNSWGIERFRKAFAGSSSSLRGSAPVLHGRRGVWLF